MPEATSSPNRKSVLITGCSEGGIGYALALAFHKLGLRVIATARRPEAMSSLEALGIETLLLDVTDEGSIKSARERASEMLGGKLDVLVNNAGRGYTCAATDLKMPNVRALFEVDLFSVMAMNSEFIPLLIAAEGRIVNIGSVAGIFPLPFGSAYSAAKAGLHAYGNVLRVELEPFNVKVMTIVTGGVKSNIARRTSIPEDSLYYIMDDLYQERRVNMSQQKAMPTDLYAKKVASAVLARHARAWFWTGNMAWATWFLDTFFPRTIYDSIVKKRFGLDIFGARLKARSAKRAD